MSVSAGVRNLRQLLFLVLIEMGQAGTLRAQRSAPVIPSTGSAVAGTVTAAVTMIASEPTAIEIASVSALRMPPETVAAPSESLRPVRAASMPPMAVISTVATPIRPAEPAHHPFWDRENKTLFAVVAGAAAADFCVTRANLANGGRELNPVTRIFTGSTPLLAANFALETGSVVGISYLFHRAGHHRLERITSLVNLGNSAGAVAYGLTHR